MRRERFLRAGDGDDAAELLRVLSQVVAARFHLPPAMLRKLLAARDPVITSGGGWLRFEGFSGCCSAYMRVDLSPDAYRGVLVGEGTTNVDFNAEMRTALARIRDPERVSLAVGSEDMTLVRGAEAVTERRVQLPVRWIRSFAEVQAFQARMERQAHLSKVEAVRFLRSLPRRSMAKTAAWVVPAAGGLRLSQRGDGGGVPVAGLERLRLLESLAPMADGLDLYADRRTGASEWQLKFGALRLALTLSAEVWRGFSGEGQLLSDLAAATSSTTVSRVQRRLRWQSELRPAELAVRWRIAEPALRAAMAALGGRGQVGYDLARAAYFHRVLPFDLAQVEALHPRLVAARRLVEGGAIRVLRREGAAVDAEVPGSEVVHRVHLAESQVRCTCPWHAKHRGARGPCKHLLAVQILLDSDSDEAP